MATLNEQLQPERMTISDISLKFGVGDIFIDDSFQRRSVWVNRNKIRLLETILMGYPMPEVYFWQSPPNSETGKIELSIVDGQQRVRAINEYISGHFKLNKSALDPESKKRSFVDRFFSDLEDDDKNTIWNYRLNVRVLPYSLSRAEIVKIFLRLNETDKSLNPQELRNAKFNGKFIQAAEEVANLPFWVKWKVFTPAMIRRMSDILISSQFLAFLRFGIEGDVTPKAINHLYDTFNDVYREKKSDVAACQATLAFIDEMFSNSDAVRKFFTVQTHFYPLFIASYMFIARNNEEPNKSLIKRLAKFAELYRANEKTENGVLVQYRLASNEGMTKKSNRELRVKTILEVMEGTVTL